MFKFIIVFLTTFSNFFSIEEKHVCVNEVITEKREILDEEYGFRLFLEEGSDKYGIGNYYLEKDDFKFELEGSMPVVEYFDNNIYICNINNTQVNLYSINIDTYDVNEFDLSNIDISSDKNTNINNDIYIVQSNNELLLMGTHNSNIDNITNRNIFIYNIITNEIKSIGGLYNEKLCYVVSKDNRLYLSIKKDLISEEPFGNGSEYVLSMLDSSYNVISNKYLNEHDFYKIYVTDNFIYYVTSTNLMMFSLDLKYLCSTDLESFKSIFISENGLIIAFCEDGGYLLDAFTFDKVDEISNTYDGYTIRMFDDKLYGYGETNVYFDVVDLRYLNIHNECYLEYENLDNVYSLFGKCDDIGREYQTYFNKTKFGHYDGEQEFITKCGIAFTIRFTYDIKPKVNLIEGMVYPSGYNIYFNGDGTLDGEFTYNNAPVFGDGEHLFELEGNNETYKVNFRISDNQISFTDMYVEEGISIKDGEEFQIRYKLKNFENYELKDIVLDEWYKSYKYENGELVITFEPLDYVYYEKQKSITIYFKEIVFLVYGKEYIYNVSKIYNFNIEYDKVETTSTYMNNEFIININDINGLSRALEIELIDYTNNNNQNTLKYFSIESSDIILDITSKSKYRAFIYLITSNNTNKYNRVLLLECDFLCQSEEEFGYLTVSNFEENLKQLKLKVNNDNKLYSVRSGSSTLYEYDSDDTLVYVIYLVGIFGSIILGVILRNIICKFINKDEL